MGWLHCVPFPGGQLAALVWDRAAFPRILSWRSLLVMTLLGWLCYTTPAMGDAVDPHAIMQQMANAYDGIYDYTALFLKRERINGKLLPLEKIELRFQEPFKVYMAWMEPYEGREIVFVKGENDNKLLVDPGGLLTFMRLSLEPTSDMATRDAHHSVLQAGLENTIRHIMREYLRGMERDQVSVRLLGHAEVDGRPVYHLECTYPADKSAGYYAYRGELWIDKAYYLPLRVEIYNWNNELYEYYAYHRLQLNPGLDETAFRLPSVEHAERPRLETQQRESTP